MNDYGYNKELEDFLLEVEGCKSKPYKDTAGKWTVGIGHLILKGEHFDIPMTKEQAIELLKVDSKIRIQNVLHYVKVKINIHQFNALVSFVYNEGDTAFQQSTLLKKLNMNDFEGVINQFKKWIYIHVYNKETKQLEPVVDKGLVNRRNKEIILWTKPMV